MYNKKEYKKNIKELINNKKFNLFKEVNNHLFMENI